MATTTRLFEKDTETVGTISDETMRLAYGKVSTPTLNITFASFVTWLITKLTATFMLRANNLSDVSSIATARKNIAAANRYLSSINYTGSGGSESSPQKINVDVSSYDITILTASASGWFILPSPSDFSGITQGTKVIIKSLNATQHLKMSNTEYSDRNLDLAVGAIAEFYYDTTYAIWRLLSTNIRTGWN